MNPHGIDHTHFVNGSVYSEVTRRKRATIRDPSGFLVQLVEIND